MPDYLPQVSRPDVLRIVTRDFPERDHQKILYLLDEFGGDWSPNKPHRVHLAILKLADGDSSKVRRCVDLARSDFRDAIAGAEYPGFMKVGFVGVDEMSAAEVKRLQEDDWREYCDWLERK